MLTEYKKLVGRYKRQAKPGVMPHFCPRLARFTGSMTPAEFQASLQQSTPDGRLYIKVERNEALLESKNCRIRARRHDGKCLAGGILNHVDPELRYLYIRSVATHTCFCLQIPENEFWVLPRPARPRPQRRKYSRRSSRLTIAR